MRRRSFIQALGALGAVPIALKAIAAIDRRPLVERLCVISEEICQKGWVPLVDVNPLDEYGVTVFWDKRASGNHFRSVSVWVDHRFSQDSDGYIAESLQKAIKAQTPQDQKSIYAAKTVAGVYLYNTMGGVRMYTTPQHVINDPPPCNTIEERHAQQRPEMKYPEKCADVDKLLSDEEWAQAYG